jgi:uncharacterized glyoxalase superfamily protein PhnB
MTERARPTISAGVYYRDPLAALKWLEAAFGFETTMVVTGPDGSLAHSELRLGEGMIMVGGEYDDRHKSPRTIGGTNTQGVHVQLEGGIEAHYERAREAGATILRELADQFYGDRTYSAEDLEGHIWSFGQTFKVMTNEEMSQEDGFTVRERL